MNNCVKVQRDGWNLLRQGQGGKWKILLVRKIASEQKSKFVFKLENVR
jgi:hypothetical protein